jgi:hypothetical protein
MLSAVRRVYNILNLESTRTPQDISVTHSFIDTNAAKPPIYGRIVVIGVGDADAIGDTVGGGTGCAPATKGVAPATKAPARTIPTNHRLM